MSELAGDEEHEPAEYDRRAHEEGKAVDAVIDHPAGRVALSDGEDHRSEEGKKNNRGKVRGLEH